MEPPSVARVRDPVIQPCQLILKTPKMIAVPLGMIRQTAFRYNSAHQSEPPDDFAKANMPTPATYFPSNVRATI
jgi:hypothetical protein